MANCPRWVTPQRQAYLADLFNRNQGFCIWGHSPCQGRWIESQKTACYWGKSCLSPNIGGACTNRGQIKVGDDTLNLPCEVLHLNALRWACDYSDHACYKPFESHYTEVEARLIKDWTIEDRQARLDIEHAIDKAEHVTNDRTFPLHGQFSGVSQDIYFDCQPEYYIETLGVSGLTFAPFARVRLASSPVRLYVDLADMLKPLSKNARRKAIRYRVIPAKLQARIDLACYQAIKDFRH